jgi:uncharacterized protein YndB with AHSA1/START domain
VDELTINRDIDLDLSEDELWALVGDGGAWANWLADDSDVVVEPGGEGDIVEAGERRHVRVDEVEQGRRVRYAWWPIDEPSSVSTVELVIVPRPAGSLLRIRETMQASSASASMAFGWHVRAVALWSLAAAFAVR